MVYRFLYGFGRWMSWASGVVLVLLFFVLAGLAAAIITFSTYYPPEKPLNLSPLLPRIEGYLAGVGVHATAGSLKVYYDDGNVVLDGQDLRLFGQDGDLAVNIEAVQLVLSRSRLFVGSPSPKKLSLEGVTLRLIRAGDSLQMAGFELANAADTQADTDWGGVVAWLNKTHRSLRWGALQQVSANRVNLLLRDDVQNTEWVLEDGLLDVSRSSTGEQGTFTAEVRRVYGGKKPLKPMPVVALFEHTKGADTATLRARLDESDVSMVADYFPPAIQNMFKAQGRVELGVLLTEGDKLGLPWVGLKLTDVTMRVPEGYSKPLQFPNLNVTVSYQPSPTDVMGISNLVAVAKNGLVLEGRGVIRGLATLVPSEVDLADIQPAAGPLEGGGISPTNPLPKGLEMDLNLTIAKGQAQQVFDLFPDKVRAFKKSLAWLRPNIMGADFTDLVAHYRGRPAGFPACGDACGLNITAKVLGGEVRYLDDLAVAKVGPLGGQLVLAGESIRFTAPEATTSAQKVRNVVVTVGELFTPGLPTSIAVSLTLAGPLDDVVRELGKINKPLPLAADGRHESNLQVYLPLVRDKPTKLEDAHITVDARLNDFGIARLPNLPNTRFEGEKGLLTLQGDTIRLESKGRLNGEPLNLVWEDDWKHEGVQAMKLNAEGKVPSAWLAGVVFKGGDVALGGGPVAISATLDENGDTLRFDVKGTAGDASATIPMLNWAKRAGVPLAFEVQGAATTKGQDIQRLELGRLVVSGGDVNVRGNVVAWPDDWSKSRLDLPTFKVGRTDGALTWDGNQLKLLGKAFDFASLTNDKDDTTTKLPNMKVVVDVATVHFKHGDLTNVKANLNHTGDVWEVGNVQALAGGSPVRVAETVMQGGRRKLVFNVADLGKLLKITDAYGSLKGGVLEGELNYDTPTVAGGVFNLKDFELQNPPTLVKLLGLLSLQQLVAGTDTVLFDKAVVPLRLEGPAVYLDKMIAEGPSLSLRLDGVYYRNASQLDMNGRLTPALPMNRLVAKIPLVGNLLTGSQDGLVVADFRMKGPAADPQIDVRPLSVLTPGLLKDIFRGGSPPKPASKPKVESNVP